MDPTQSEQVVLPFGTDSGQQSFEQYKTRDALQVTSGDAARASFDLAWQDTATGLIARTAAMGNSFTRAIGVGADLQNSGARDLSPEEANQRYPNMPTKWNQPVNPYVAQMMSDREDERAKLMATLEAGPQDIWSQTKYAGAGLLAHAMDPLEFGAAEVAGWGVGGLVSKSAWGARASNLVRSGVATPLERLGFHAAEAVPGNLIQSTALEAGTALVDKQEGKAFDPVEAMKNIAVQTFFGSVLHTGIKEFSFQAQNRLSRFVNRNSPEADLAIARTAVSQMQQGVTPNVEPILEAIAKETDVNDGYQYQPIVKGEFADKSLYVATDAADGFNPNSSRHFGEEVGRGTKVTDNAQVANAASSRAMADSEGHVWEVKAKDLNPIDLQTALPEDAKPAFKEALNGVVNDKTFEIASPLEMMRKLNDEIDAGNIPEERITKLQEDLKQLGYNAFQNDGTSVGGYSHSPHNDLTVFDNSVLDPQKQWAGNGELRNDPTQPDIQKQIDYMKDPRNRWEATPKAIDSFEENFKKFQDSPQGKSNDFSYAENDAQAYQEHLQSLDNQGILDESGKADLEALRNFDKVQEVNKTLFKALESCTRG